MPLTGSETDPTYRTLAQSWYVELPSDIIRCALFYEDGGRALPMYRADTLQPEHQSSLFLQVAYDPGLRRNVRRAHLRAAGADALRRYETHWCRGLATSAAGRTVHQPYRLW